MKKAKPKKKVIKKIIKKAVKKVKSKKAKKIAPVVKMPKIEGKLVGKVSHYFSNIEVCVIKLSAPLSQGDEIRVIGGEATDFNQKVISLQVDYKEIKKAKKGNSVGLKIKEKVREGYKVYRV